MSSTIARRAGSTALRAPRARTARQQYRRTYAEEARRTDANNNDKNVLQQGARRDPELYVPLPLPHPFPSPLSIYSLTLS